MKLQLSYNYLLKNRKKLLTPNLRPHGKSLVFAHLLTTGNICFQPGLALMIFVVTAFS